MFSHKKQNLSRSRSSHVVKIPPIISSSAKNNDDSLQKTKQSSFIEIPSIDASANNTSISLLKKGSRSVIFCMTWDMDVAMIYQFSVEYTGTLKGKTLRNRAAMRLTLSPQSIVLQQKRGYKFKDGPPLVLTSEGTFATSSGKIVPNNEIPEKIWCTILDNEQVPLAGPLSLHLMVSIHPLETYSDQQEALRQWCIS